MDEKPDQIVEHIERQRDTLGRNLDELQTRIRSTTDMRVQFDKHPLLMLGVAMGGGLLLGAMVGGGSSSSRRSTGYRGRSSSWRTGGDYSSTYGGSTSSSMSSSSGSSYMGSSTGMGSSAGTSMGLMGSGSGSSYNPAVEHQRSKAMETVDNIKGALLGYFATQAKDWIEQVLPGFGSHFDETAQKNKEHKQSLMGTPSYQGGSYSGQSSGGASAYGGGSSSYQGTSWDQGSSNTSSSDSGTASGGSSSQQNKPEPVPAL